MKYSLATDQNDFWSARIRQILNVMIPLQLKLLEDEVPDAEPSHAIENFRIAAGLQDGAYYGMVFQDSDVGKWIEAAAYKLKITPDVELEKKIDEIVEIIGKAQQQDGYVNTYFTIKEPGKRWTNLQECHELYCAGHLMEGAVAYYEATGKREFLDIMCRMADHIDSVFGAEEGKLKGYPGHSEVELALFRLYRVTGIKRYLNLAKYFIDERGKEPYYFVIERQKREGSAYFNKVHALGAEYAQWHQPIREQKDAVGHAVRALYLYASVAYVAKETGDETLLEAARALWESAANRKMYITGSFGATHIGEAFMPDYELPNDSAYAETCASIAMLFFGKAMLQIKRDGAVADVMERILFNGMLSGMSLSADRFFYVNPLETVQGISGQQPGYKHALPKRPKWFGCACCPPNLARLIASLPEYAYGEDDGGIVIHQFIGGTVRFDAFGGVEITHQSNYPWEGNLSWTIKGEKAFTMSIRIPKWAKGATLTVNSEQINLENMTHDGYVTLSRDFTGETEICLALQMEAKRQYAHPYVRANAGCVAFTYGPLVYCFEGTDNPAPLSALRVKKDSKPTLLPFDAGLLNGVRPMQVAGAKINADGMLYSDTPAERHDLMLKAVPYYAFANRESEDMRVWMPETGE